MHRSRSISDISSFSTVSVLSFDPSSERALCVEELQLNSGFMQTCPPIIWMGKINCGQVEIFIGKKFTGKK